MTANTKPAARRPAARQTVAPKAVAPKPATPAGPGVGDVVTYRFQDTVTGDALAGHAIVLAVQGGSVTLAPLSPHRLHLAADAVAAADAPAV